MSEFSPGIKHFDWLSAISISGPDRVSFLQGQLTQDVESATPEHSPLTGWTTAKGRLLLVSPLIAWQDALHLIAPKTMVADISRRLQMFVLRARVAIETDSLTVGGTVTPFASGGDREPPWPGNPGDVVSDSDSCLVRRLDAPNRVWELRSAERCESPTPASVATDELAARLSDIAAGAPTITPNTAEAFVPQMLNLDILGGISFTKGCYVGQEIIARTHNLGRIKRRMQRFAAAGDSAPMPGEVIHASDGRTGRIATSGATDGRTELLAVVPTAKPETPWFVDKDMQRPLQREPLPYRVPD